MLFLFICALLVSSAVADTDFMKKFKDDYATLDQDLLNNPGEVGMIRNFVYQKDVATFTFTEGQIFFLRYVNDRPTTAIFIGKGNVKIDIPSHAERQSLMYASGDSTVNNDFEICFLRFADDFDLLVHEQFKMEQKVLGWKDFTVAKQAQGEFFFRPIIAHTYDNYFELLRSCYERAADGYFFADFNRYTYIFDPNRPEEVIVGYEKEGGAAQITDGSIFQRKEHGIYDDTLMSNIPYLNTIVNQNATLYLSGSEGNNLDSSVVEVALQINRDSAKFVNIFLHYNLDIDSVQAENARIDFHRRKDFTVTGLILPNYYHRGDTVNLKLFYHGKNFVSPLPYTADPTPAPCKVTVIAPKDFTYVIPGMGTPEDIGKGKQKIVAEPLQPMTQLQFRSYSKSYTSTPGQSLSGLPLTFNKSPQINKKNFDCFVPDDIFQPAVAGALDFVAARLGNPPNTFEMAIHPEGGFAIPGFAEITQVYCLRDGTGGIQLVAGNQLARQWFGPSARPATDRESWLADGVALYLGLMYTQNALPGGPFYSELLYRRDVLMTELDRQHDQPLATGDRVADTVRVYKGAWVIHMLRQMMFDLDKRSDRTFLKFMQELSSTVNSRTFTNADVIRVAEKHAGIDLKSFFALWLYGIGVPEYDVNYTIEAQGAEWVVKVNVATAKAPETFSMPVTLQVVYEDGTQQFVRQTIAGKQTSFQLGPFAAKPKEIVFNEFASVLSKDKVTKGKA
jgi:hypothetical protein